MRSMCVTAVTQCTAMLDYPIEALPEPGRTLTVAPAVKWVRMPLPIALDHINLWLLDAGDGWLAVDCGLATDETRALWDKVFDEGLDGKPVKEVIVTHMHPDHVGLAGWLVRRWQATFRMPRTEYLMCRNLVADTGHEAPPEGLGFYRAAGFDEKQLADYAARFGGFGEMVSPLPKAFDRLQAGDIVPAGEAAWEVIVGTGHSPEHACLFNAHDNVLIAGDQLLPAISSIVGVWPTEPRANPLRDWLDSCAMLKERVPADVLVLPSHGRPFHGAHPRLDKLVRHHERALDRLAEHCRQPRRAVDAFSVLFRAQITDGLLIMATAEAVAHLNYLVEDGRIEADRDDAGVLWYTARP
ncbi:MAG: MBL fold metallo-hydrolase [Pseudomonadota bacterium]